MSSSTELILASSSPFRQELLQRLRIPFISVSPEIDERAKDTEKPEETALRLAQEKALKIALNYPAAFIIGCDQVATLDGMQIGKPGTHENAVKQLQMMRGRSVIFHSALCLYNAKTKNMQAAVVPFTVDFRELSDAEIENYLRIEQPYNCAGSAKSEGLGISLIKAMHGTDPNALIGLPLIALINMFNNEGINVI
ncbi:septum formation protein Maf [Methylovorus sp. MM2]|uniref:Maf family nucleotide pyrophosphatase n=1 Tax=Methylovorus sp. MM2 TaxID=1848038 RepID=UPI0007DF458A|nr:Maf family nucleotide pyrophosphatase [Methylovorus sp. MM2]OAM52993.1 septum formation protein Maf [Methylovorus sp. MM2]